MSILFRKVLPVSQHAQRWSAVTSFAHCRREIHLRRISVPVQLRKPEGSHDEELIPGQLLFKWSTASPRSSFVIPIVLSRDDASAAGSRGTLQQTKSAQQTFHRLHLHPIDVATLLSVLEKRQTQGEIVKKRLTLRFGHDVDGSLNISGLALPFNQKSAVDETSKYLFATILDGEMQSLLKIQLDAMLTEMFGIEHMWYKSQRVSAKYGGREAETSRSQPPPPPRTNSPRYASELEDVETTTVGNAIHMSSAETSVISSNKNVGEKDDEEQLPPSVGTPEVATTPIEDRVQQIDGNSLVNSDVAEDDIAEKPKKKNKRKSPAKQKKQNKDKESQLLFDF